MILTTPPPEPPAAAEWVTESVQAQIVEAGRADDYSITEFDCVDDDGDFVCVSPWIHHGRTEYLSGRFTWTGDGYRCHGWTVSSEPPSWFQAAPTLPATM